MVQSKNQVSTNFERVGRGLRSKLCVQDHWVVDHGQGVAEQVFTFLISESHQTCNNIYLKFLLIISAIHIQPLNIKTLKIFWKSFRKLRLWNWNFWCRYLLFSQVSFQPDFKIVKPLFCFIIHFWRRPTSRTSYKYFILKKDFII